MPISKPIILSLYQETDVLSLCFLLLLHPPPIWVSQTLPLGLTLEITHAFQLNNGCVAHLPLNIRGIFLPVLHDQTRHRLQVLLQLRQDREQMGIAADHIGQEVSISCRITQYHYDCNGGVGQGRCWLGFVQPSKESLRHTNQPEVRLHVVHRELCFWMTLI